VTPRRPKVPTTPSRALTCEPGDVVSIRPTLWRIHRVRGAHVLPWNGFRIFGPLLSARYDPHPEPPGDHAGSGITYAATDLTTSVAEVFQTSRTVVVTDDLALTAWIPTRDLRLLDLTGTWALRNGAAQALTAARRPTCRAWSAAIHSTWPDLEGLWAPSTLTGSPIVALYESAADSFPDAPAVSRPLDTPMVWTLVRDAARSISYRAV
jgi:hypothetical protein